MPVHDTHLRALPNAAAASPRYVLTTPVRNELAVLPELLETVESLQPRPVVWLVIDDHSDDASPAWLQERAAERPWMHVADSCESADEYLGAHVARVKRWGLEEAIRLSDSQGMPAEYAGVLDADMTLPCNHYSALIAHFETDPRLGVVSSTLQVPTERGLEPEPFQRPDLPRGPTQFFRRRCLEEIGGLPPWPGFDGAANVKAQLAGWRTRMVPDVTATHGRATATRFGHATGFERKGRYAWFLGVHPLLVAARSLAYAARTPHSAGYYFAKGWLQDALKRAPRCPDPAVRRAYGIARVIRAARQTVGR